VQKNRRPFECDFPTALFIAVKRMYKKQKIQPAIFFLHIISGKLNPLVINNYLVRSL
jgi:hypothetical protein